MSYGRWRYGDTSYGGNTGPIDFPESVAEGFATWTFESRSPGTISPAATWTFAAGSPAAWIQSATRYGLAYIYENVGTNQSADRTGVSYIYENVGLDQEIWYVGPLPIFGKKEDGVVYVYENVT